jgi:hypothetical protein
MAPKLIPYLVYCECAIIDMGVQASLGFISFPYMPSNGLHGRSDLMFGGITILFSIVAVLIYIPTKNMQESPYLHILART